MIYTYTGNNFTTVVAPYTTNDKITGTITFSSRLGNNVDVINEPAEAFSFSDGVQTLDNSNSDLVGDDFITNNLRDIIQWYVLITSETETQQIITQNMPFLVSDDGVSDLDNSISGFNDDEPGTWVERELVPEPPSTLPLLSAGLLGLVFLRRGRRGMLGLTR